MHVVFDLDGCLLDSKELIRQAYREAGSDAPEDVLALEGVNWPGREETRGRKNVAYLKLLHDHPDIASWLPPWSVAKRLYTDGHEVGLLTGAPGGTVAILRSQTPLLWPFRYALDGLSTVYKMWYLSLDLEGGIYIDDQARLVDLPAHWKFIHYVGQTADELYAKINELREKT